MFPRCWRCIGIPYTGAGRSLPRRLLRQGAGARARRFARRFPCRSRPISDPDDHLGDAAVHLPGDPEAQFRRLQHRHHQGCRRPLAQTDDRGARPDPRARRPASHPGAGIPDRRRIQRRPHRQSRTRASARSPFSRSTTAASIPSLPPILGYESKWHPGLALLDADQVPARPRCRRARQRMLIELFGQSVRAAALPRLCALRLPRRRRRRDQAAWRSTPIPAGAGTASSTSWRASPAIVIRSS